MKPIIIFSTVVTLFLYSQFNSQYGYINLETNFAYLLANSEAEIDTFITCESCHGDADTYPATVGLAPANNFDSSLIVHQENHPEFVEGLEAFVETHTTSEAEAKNVDRQKVIELIAEL